MAFTLPKLKYAHDALEPYLSQDNVHYHYGKHTKKYFDTTNELIKGTKFADSETLEKLIESGRLRKETKLYNNVHQAYNHQLYWENLAPKEEAGKPSDELLAQFERHEGFDKIKERFEEAANSGFGSYWMWLLITSDDKFVITTTQDADTPENTILLVVDGWEHSWYPTYFNDKGKYFKNIWNIINWNVVNERYTTRTKA
jgi:Fe-Mn family superoxide dismutase